MDSDARRERRQVEGYFSISAAAPAGAPCRVQTAVCTLCRLRAEILTNHEKATCRLYGKLEINAEHPRRVMRRCELVVVQSSWSRDATNGRVPFTWDNMYIVLNWGRPLLILPQTAPHFVVGNGEYFTFLWWVDLHKGYRPIALSASLRSNYYSGSIRLMLMRKRLYPPPQTNSGCMGRRTTISRRRNLCRGPKAERQAIQDYNYKRQGGHEGGEVNSSRLG